MKKIKNKKTGEVRLVEDSELKLYGINLPEAKNGIHIDKSKRGTFKAQASKMGMGVQEAASKILNAPEGKYSSAMRRKANFAKNFAKQDGGYTDIPEFFPGDEGYYEPGGEGYMGGVDNLYNSSRFSSPMFQPLKKQKIGVPEIKQAPNFKQTIKTPQINSYDFYDPQTGNINQPQNNNTKFSEISSYIPTNSIFNNYYLNKGKQFRKKAIDSFSKLEDGGFGGGDYWNLASGIVNAATADINTIKGFTDIAQTLKTNAAIEQIKAQNKKQNLFSQYENSTPTFQNSWGGNNPLDNGYIPVGEYGMSIKEIGGQGFPNVEVEGSEHIHLPNGFSEEIQGASHSEGGIPLNLPQGSKVLSEKLKHPETGKSYSKMAKKFQTKKDFKNLESKFSDKVNKETANLNIDLKNKALDNLFLAQEVNKLTGVHGKKPQESAIEDYTMKYGGMKKMQGGGGTNWNQEVFDTPYGYLTPTGINLNKTPLTNWEQIKNIWETSRNRKYSNFGELQEDIYDTKLDEAESGNKQALEDLRKMWETYGITNQNEKFFKSYQDKINRGEDLSIEDLKSLRGNYIDYRRGKRSLLPTPVAPKVDLKEKQPAISGSSSKIKEINKENTKLLQKGINPNITAFQLPDAYLRDPITVNNLNPEFYQPTTISPYLNDIQRLQYATNANLGTSGAELATRANLFGQGLTEYGKRYYDTSTFNAQTKTQAAKDNAQTKQAVNQFNLSNYIRNARNPQLQREAVITEQKRLDRDAQLKTFAEKEHEQAVRNYLEDIYNPQYALNENFNNPYNLKSAEAESEEAKKAKAYETLYGKKKYGGKVKIKAKKKK